MKKLLGVFLFVTCCGWATVAVAQSRRAPESQDKPLRSPDGGERRAQPGAKGRPTIESDATPKFDMDYFVGEWKFESTLSDSPLGAGGPVSGIETVRNLLDGRFWDLTIEGEGADGPFTGNGVVMYQDGFFGQYFARYEITAGVALLKTGALGCDLGGTCNMYFETPPFEHDGATLQLKGRYYLTSPFSYRLTTMISVDKGPYRDLGTVWYTKEAKAAPESGKK